FIHCERVLVMADGEDAVCIWSVGADRDRDDSVERFCSTGIDSLDLRMWMRRVQNLADQHAGQREIVCVFARAGGLASGVNHGNGAADDGEISHALPPSPSAPLQSPL